MSGGVLVHLLFLPSAGAKSITHGELCGLVNVDEACFTSRYNFEILCDIPICRNAIAGPCCKKFLNHMRTCKARESDNGRSAVLETGRINEVRAVQ